jgi:hypothetical protein
VQLFIRTEKQEDSGNPLSLMGIDASAAKKHILKCLKIHRKYLGMHIDVLCYSQMFERKYYFYDLCKKIIFSVSKLLFTGQFLSFRQFFPSQKFMGEHKRFISTTFKPYLKCIFVIRAFNLIKQNTMSDYVPSQGGRSQVLLLVSEASVIEVQNNKARDPIVYSSVTDR